jgi:glycosyltransferase involved in cell wall biosynthesis
MPVFNGEKYLHQSIESILQQTYYDFELIISDNGSIDHTQEICQKYAALDNRIRYYRNRNNIGGPRNYNKVFQLSSSEYFKWAAYDDVLAPEFLKKCINVLETDTSVVGCCCKTGRIDQNGNFLGYYNEGLLRRIGSSKPHERFRDLIGLYYTTTPFHGVYRSSMFGKSQLHGTYIGADRNLVAELSLMGPIFEISECLFFWREHPDSYTSTFYGSTRTHTLDRLRAETSWWSRESGTYFPHWKNCTEYFRSVNRVELGLLERFLCYTQILGWFMEEGRRFLANDIVLFLLQHSNFASKLFSSRPIKNISTSIKRRL